MPESSRQVARAAIAADHDDAPRATFFRKLGAKSRHRGQIRPGGAAGKIPLDASESARGIERLVGLDPFYAIRHGWIEDPRHDRRRQVLETFDAVKRLGGLHSDELNRSEP